MLFKMALRNILRHKRRTLISVITIAVGIMFYIAMDSLFNGVDRLLVESIVKFSDSSIVVYSQEYDENRRGYPLDRGVKDFEFIKKTVSAIDGVEGVVYRTQFLGELVFGNKSKYIVGTVINPSIDSQVFEIKDHIKGSYLSGDGEEVLIGSILAKKLGIRLGDYITISARTVEGTYNALDFKVVGLVESPNVLLNESGVIISYTSANKLLNLRDTKTLVHVKVKWNKGESIPFYLKNLEKISKEMRDKLEGYRVYTVKDIYGDFLLLMDQKRTTSYLITFLVLIIAGVGIANSILMAVYERIREIGVLMAMGMKPITIRRLFLLEGTLIGVIGGLFGIILGVIADIFMIYVGYDISSLYKELNPSDLGMPVWGVFYGEWNIWAFVVGGVFATLTAIISAYIPSRYASKLRVTECLKFV
ncbi:MAG: FtsX-like permease family protein [Brevinematia bacterium]